MNSEAPNWSFVERGVFGHLLPPPDAYITPGWNGFRNSCRYAHWHVSSATVPPNLIVNGNGVIMLMKRRKQRVAYSDIELFWTSVLYVLRGRTFYEISYPFAYNVRTSRFG